MLTPDSLVVWLAEYGNFALFGLLAVGIVGLPIPDETLITFAGVMMAKGHLALIPTILTAYIGSCFGITVSYVIGRTAGIYLIKRYGPRVGLTQTKLDQVHRWFERIGKWTLCVGYFIPGVRHLVGYVAGATALNFGQFALFAYLGAALWVSLFLMLGYFSGQHLTSVVQFLIDNIENLFLLLSFLALLGLLISVIWRQLKR